MRVPLGWLADYVDLDGDPIDIADKLTAAGMKVERIERPGDGIDGIVVGEVLEIDRHPNADKLILVQVQVADHQHTVVCGASNFKVGDRVPVALPGSRVPGLSIERRKIRGEVSDGMLCSARELGLGEDHSGILILADDAPLGEDIRKVLGLDRAIFELEITPNRPDAMSLIGVAREVVACFGGTLRLPDLTIPSEGAMDASDLASVTVDDPKGCPRYVAKVVTDVSVGPSPEWVQSRLLAAGVRPISNVVDATNYVLLVSGQPLHAFDLDLLDGHRIIVRSARDGEEIDTLDGSQRKLTADDLVIADASRPVAIAGVMGGVHSEVNAGTKRILLESAYFDPPRVFATGRRLDLRTEASARFERGADPNAAGWVADLACRLIVEWAGGEVAKGAIDVYPSKVEMQPVSLRPDRARSLLGVEISDQEMVEVLDRLDLAPSFEKGLITVVPPTRRQDLRIEEDLIEEVARVIGYERIPLTLPPGRSRSGSIPESEKTLRKARGILAGAGLFEARTSTLVGPKTLDPMGYPEDSSERKGLRLVNPLNREESVLRTSLLPGLLGVAARNFSLRNLSVRVFEIGPCFIAAHERHLPDEPLRLGIVVGGVSAQQWHEPERMLDVFDAKGALEALLAGLGLKRLKLVPTVDPVFHDTRCARVVVDGDDVGILGELAPNVVRAWDLPFVPAALELDLGALIGMVSLPSAPEAAGRFPAVLQDLAVTVPEEVDSAALIETATQAGGEILESVRVFDVYRGPQVGEGRKSLALAMMFRSRDRTLTEQEASEGKKKIAGAISEAHQGIVRGEG